MTTNAAQQGNAHWYIRRTDGDLGPLTGVQLKAMAADGLLKPQELVSPDNKKWVEAADVQGLDFPLHGRNAGLQPGQITASASESSRRLPNRRTPERTSSSPSHTVRADVDSPKSFLAQLEAGAGDGTLTNTTASQSPQGPSGSLPTAKPLQGAKPSNRPPPIPKDKQSKPPRRQTPASPVVHTRANYTCPVKEIGFVRKHEGKVVFSMQNATFSSGASKYVCKLNRASASTDMVVKGGSSSGSYTLFFKTPSGKRTFVLSGNAAEVFRDWAGVGLVHAVDRRRAKSWGAFFLLADLLGLAVMSLIIFQGMVEEVGLATLVVAVSLHLIGLGTGAYCLDRGNRLGLNLVAFSWFSFAFYNLVTILEPSAMPKDERGAYVISGLFFGLVQLGFGSIVYWQSRESKTAELHHSSQDRFAGWLRREPTYARPRTTPIESIENKPLNEKETPRDPPPKSKLDVEEKICAEFHPMNPAAPDVREITKLGNAATGVLIKLFRNPQTEYGDRSQPLLAATLARLAHEGDSEAYEFLKQVVAKEIPVVQDQTGEAALKVAANCVQSKSNAR